jgi:hypothetical protein
MTEQDWSEQDWQNLIDAARSLMARVDGDVELARGLWQDAFTEAERIEQNLLYDLESEMQEDGERAAEAPIGAMTRAACSNYLHQSKR